MIFATPPLNTVVHIIKGQELVLHEFTAAVYYEHLLTENGYLASKKLLAKKAAEADGSAVVSDSEPEVPSVEQIIAGFRDDSSYRLMMISCSLAPGYPDRAVADICAELTLNLSDVQVREISNKVTALQGMDNPKPLAPVVASSTSSDES